MGTIPDKTQQNANVRLFIGLLAWRMVRILLTLETTVPECSRQLRESWVNKG